MIEVTSGCDRLISMSLSQRFKKRQTTDMFDNHFKHIDFQQER
jgi:hypothetical protein